MRSLITALILALAGTLSCGMMEDFYEYSGQDFKTMIVVENMPSLFVSYNGGVSFSNIPLNYNLNSWYANSYGEIMTIEDDTINFYNIYITYPDGTKIMVFSTPYSGVFMKAVTADVNGDFYFCFYTENPPTPGPMLFRLPYGESFVQQVSQMAGFTGDTASIWRLWSLEYNGTPRLFLNDAFSSNLYVSYDGGMNFSLASTFGGLPADMIVQGSTIFVSTGDAVNGVWQSSDGGSSFYSSLSIGSSIALAAGRNRTYAAYISSIWYKEGNSSWIETNQQPSANNTDVAIDSTGKLYVLTSIGGIMVSSDNGNNWININMGIYGTRMQVVEYQY